MKIFTSIIITFVLLISPAYGAGSKTIQSKASNEIVYYNKGVKLMFDKKLSLAEKWFQKALASKEQFAEAHNNLAYVLRKQGPDRFEESLKHYNRAIELNPNLAQPYMYRGVLHVQMGKTNLAKKDYALLKKLDGDLAVELKYVIENGREKQPEKFFGVSHRLN